MTRFTPIEDHEALCGQVDDIIRVIETQKEATEATASLGQNLISCLKTINTSC